MTVIIGTNGDNTITGTSSNDDIFGKAGNDIINAGNGNDDVYGGTGDDIVNGDAGNDRLDGNDGNDTIDGGSGNDLIEGDDGNDILEGGTGNDRLSGGDDNDTITGGAGNDGINGGGGVDTAIFSGAYASYDILNLFGLVIVHGQDGHDHVVNVEFLKFDDGTYNVASRSFTHSQQTLVSITATDGSGTEAADGVDFTFTFTRTGDLSQALTVNYTIAPAAADGATPGADFPAQPGTITFAAGSATATLQFSATDDLAIENTESFSVVVDAGAGYEVGTASASGSIQDNDFPPAVVSLTPAVVETTEGGALSFTFTRTGGNPAAPLTITYIVNDGPPAGGATRADGDFAYPTGLQTLTFAAGQTIATITVQTNDDAAVETDESFPVLLAGGVDYTVDPVNNGSTAVIHDNDVAALPLVSVVATDGSGTEAVDGADFAFTFSRIGDTSQALTVNYSIIPAPVDGATPGVDFPTQTGTITFAAGSATAVLSFDAVHDAVVENSEFLSVVLGVGAGYQVDIPNATANGSIADGTIYGTNGADSLSGTSDPDAILGLGGDDGIGGGAGDDYLDGGAGFDRAIYTNAGAGVSIMLAAGTATIGASVDTLRSIEFARGSAHADTYDATGFGLAGAQNVSSETGPNANFNGFEGLGGNDTITGNGNTRVEYDNATGGVLVDLQLGTAHAIAGDAGIGVDTITVGTTGPNNAPLVSGVRGSAHDDQLFGSNNFDNLGTPQFETFESFRGGLGNDLIDGRGGGDRADYSVSTGAVTADFRGGTNAGDGFALDGLGFIDTLFSIEMVQGGGQNDFFYGGIGKNIFRGGGGNDWFDGGLGNDDFIGDQGADTFAFTTAAAGNTDALHDFVTGVDTIGLSTSVYGNAMLTGGGVRLVHQGDPMTNEATFIYDTNPASPFNGMLMFDADGSGSAAAMTVAVLVDSSQDLVVSDLFWINDGAPPPTVSVRETNSGSENVNGTTTVVNEGETLHFIFERTGAVDDPLTITYNFEFNFDADPSDVVLPGGSPGPHTITFGAGQSAVTLDVLVVDDGVDESNPGVDGEDFFVSIQPNPSDYMLATFDGSMWPGGPPVIQILTQDLI